MFEDIAMFSVLKIVFVVVVVQPIYPKAGK